MIVSAFFLGIIFGVLWMKWREHLKYSDLFNPKPRQGMDE